jgi:hypothetical protein
MKMINNFLRIACLSGILLVMIGSCKKTKDQELNLPRQFMPGDIDVTAGETEAKLVWSASLFATPDVPYTVEISTDTLFQSAPHLTRVTNAPQLTLSENDIDIEVKYFARIKTNSVNTTAESGWVYSNSFRITGEQIFFTVLDGELKDKKVTLRWREYADLTKIILTTTGGSPIEVPLTATDVTDKFKIVEGLTAQTTYTASIFQNALRKGIINFTTKEPSIYTTVLTSADNLVDAVAAAADGDMIGLEPGTYNAVDGTGAFVNLVVAQKSITLASVSGNPADTKVNFKEITLKGTGAGIKVMGIGFDGLAAGSASAYFLNLVGLTGDSEAADFKSIEVDNCTVSNMGNCFLRANRAGNNAHKIDKIKVNNSIISDSRYLSAYTFFTMDKLEFKSLELVNSTFYRLGRAFIGYSTNITVPVVPSVIIDHCTINSFGRDGRNNFFADANANQLNLEITNTIIANTPMAGQTTGTSLIRGSVATASMTNSNTFNLSDGVIPIATNLTFPALVTQQNNKTENLGWTESTNDFTLPVLSELRTSGSAGGPVGDPRWAF